MKFFSRLFGFERNEAYKRYKRGMKLYNQNKFIQAIENFHYMLKKKDMSNSVEYNLAKFYCGQACRNQGIIQFAQRKNEQALSNFKLALKYNPNHTDLNYFIGICLNNIGNFQEAMEAFDKLREVDPENIPNKLKIGIIFCNLGMWDSAENVNRSILEKKPEYADVHYNLGLTLMNQGKSPDAVESFDNALKINPNYLNARLKLATAQICMEKHHKAFENLTAILEINPEYADVNYLIGVLKEECNELLDSIKYLKQAIEINPKYKNAQLKLIMVYCKLGKIEKAKKQIEEVVKLYPDDKRMNSAQKLIHRIADLSSNELDDIANQLKIIWGEDHLLNEFNKNLDIMPNFSEMIAMFSSSKYVKGDTSISEIMIPLISEHIRKHPTYPDLYNSLGAQLLFAANSVDAEKAFTKAVELNPDYVTARINLLNTLARNGKYEDAYEHGKNILSKKLPYPDVYYTLAEILIALGKYDEALKNADQVLQIKPSMKKVHLFMARIHEKKGCYDLAVREINKYLTGPMDPKLEADANKMLKRIQKKM